MCSLGGRGQTTTNKTTIVLPASADLERTELTPSCLTEAAAFGESVSLCTACDFFTTREILAAQPWQLVQNGNHGDVLSSSGKGVSEYCSHKHNGAAVTGHSKQSSGLRSREGLPLTAATVGSLRHKVMDTGST